MERSFRGEYTFKVDRKGRMSIPADFRRVLEAGDPEWTDGLRPNLVLVYGANQGKYLEGYTVSEARAQEAKINRLPSSALKRRLIREFVSQSIPIQIDPDGRLVIPQRFRDMIGLEAETIAVYVGALGTFQLWAEARYNEFLDEEGEEDLGFDIPDGTNSLDALDMVLAQMEGS